MFNQNGGNKIVKTGKRENFQKIQMHLLERTKLSGIVSKVCERLKTSKERQILLIDSSIKPKDVWTAIKNMKKVAIHLKTTLATIKAWSIISILIFIQK